MTENKYKKGHFIAIGLAIGLPLGVPIGLVLGNIAIGPAIGLPFGLLLGSIMEKKYNPNPGELTEDDKKKRNRTLWITAVAGIAFLVLLIGLYISRH